MFTLHILSFISQSLLTKSCVQLTGTCSTLHWCLHVKPRMQSIQQEPVFLIENGEDLVTTYLCSCHLVPRSPEWCSRLYSTMWADGKKSHPLPAWITNNSWQLFSQVYLSGRKKKEKKVSWSICNLCRQSKERENYLPCFTYGEHRTVRWV